MLLIVPHRTTRTWSLRPWCSRARTDQQRTTTLHGRSNSTRAASVSESASERVWFTPLSLSRINLATNLDSIFLKYIRDSAATKATRSVVVAKSASTSSGVEVRRCCMAATATSERERATEASRSAAACYSSSSSSWWSRTFASSDFRDVAFSPSGSEKWCGIFEANAQGRFRWFWCVLVRCIALDSIGLDWIGLVKVYGISGRPGPTTAITNLMRCID